MSTLSFEVVPSFRFALGVPRCHPLLNDDTKKLAFAPQGHRVTRGGLPSLC